MLARLYRQHSALCKMLLAAVVFVVVYMIYGYQLGETTYNVLLSALDSHSYVEDNPYADIISDEEYYHLMAHKYGDYDEANGYSYIHCKKPFVLHWFAGAYVWSRYDYSYYLNGEEMVCLSDVGVQFTYKLQNGQWHITDCRVGSSVTGA